MRGQVGWSNKRFQYKTRKYRAAKGDGRKIKNRSWKLKKWGYQRSQPTTRTMQGRLQDQACRHL